MQPIILVIHLVLAVALVAVILMQRSEGGAANLTGGGGLGGFMSARGAANFLTKLTTGLAAAFIATSVLLAIFSGNEAGPSSIMDKAGTTTQSTPAAQQPAKSEPAKSAKPSEPVEPAAPSVPLSE